MKLTSYASNDLWINIKMRRKPKTDAECQQARWDRLQADLEYLKAFREKDRLRKAEAKAKAKTCMLKSEKAAKNEQEREKKRRQRAAKKTMWKFQACMLVDSGFIIEMKFFTFTESLD